MSYNGAYPSLVDQFDDAGPHGGPRRIAILTQDIFGPVRNAGIGTAYRHAAEFCAAEGHDVTILFTQGRHAHDRTIEYWIDFYAERGIRFIPAEPPRFRVRTPSNALRWSHAGYHALVRHGPFDIVHSSECGASAYYPLIAKRAFGRFGETLFCIKTSSPNLWSREGNWENLPIGTGATIAAMERLCVEQADLVIAPSQHMLNWMGEHGYRLPARLCVHPNIMPASMLGTPTGADRADAAETREICFFGRLEPRKGLALFADAVARVAPLLRARQVEVTFLGKQVQAFDFRLFRKEFEARTGLTATVHTGFDAVQVNAYLGEPGRVAVIPSLLDNSPFTVYECLVNGIPFIASDVGGIPELVHPDDRAALLFKPRPAALATALERLVDQGLAPGRLAFDPAESHAHWAAFHHHARYVAAPSPTVTPGGTEILPLDDDGMADIDALQEALGRTDAPWLLLHEPGIRLDDEQLARLADEAVDPEIVGVAPFLLLASRPREQLPAIASTGESVLEYGYIAPGALLLRRHALEHALTRLEALGVIQRTFLQELALLATELGTIVPSADATVQAPARARAGVARTFARNRLLFHLTRRYGPEIANRMRLYAELADRNEQLRKISPILTQVREDIAFVNGLWAGEAA